MKKTITAYFNLDERGFKRGLARSKRDLAEFRGSANLALTRLAAGFAAAAAASAIVGAKFQQSMANVGSVANATAADMARLEGKARSLGSTTAYSASQAAEAMYSLASGGMKTNEIISASEGVLKLAGATMSEMGTTAELTMAGIKGFGLQAKDTGRVVNVFAASIQSSMLNMDRLSDSMKYVASLSSAAGMEIEDTTAALGLLANAGMHGSQAGTALKNAIGKLIAPSEELAGLLGGVSLSGDGMVAVLRKLQTEGITTEQVMELFGERGGLAMLNMLKQGADELETMTGKLTGTQAAWDMYGRQMDTVQGQFQIVRSSLEETAIAIFDTFKDKAKSVLTWFSGFINENRDKIVSAFRKVVSAIESVVGWLRDIITWVRKYDDESMTLVRNIGILVAGLYALATAQRVYNAILAMNPWTLALVGVTALVTGVQILVDRMGGWGVVWIKLQSVVKAGLLDIGKGVAIAKLGLRNFGDVWPALVKMADVALTAIVETLKGAGTVIAKVGKALAMTIINPFKAKETWAEVKAAAVAGWEDLAAGVAEKAKDIWAPFTTKHADELEKIREHHRSEMEALAQDTAAALEKAKTTPPEEGAPPAGEEAGAEWMAPMFPSPEAAGEFMYGPEPPPDYLAKRYEKQDKAVLKHMKGFHKAMGKLFDDAWKSMLDTHMSATERFRMLWKNALSMVWDWIGDTVKRWVAAKATESAATTASEAQKTAATQTGVMARMGAMAKEVAGAVKTGVVLIWKAVAGFYSAFASIPFGLGIPLALGAIYTMYRVLEAAKKMFFHGGGMVTAGGPARSDEVDARLRIGEYVMPEGPTARYFPLLEGMRRGTLPAADLGLAGGGGLTVNVHLPSDSILFAEDSDSVIRLATVVHDAIEDVVKRQYRGRSDT